MKSLKKKKVNVARLQGTRSIHQKIFGTVSKNIFTVSKIGSNLKNMSQTFIIKNSTLLNKIKDDINGEIYK